jgi:hypothetical protein
MNYVLVLSALLMVADSGSGEPAVDPIRYGWYTNYADGKAEANRTGKPIMLVFRCDP